MERDGDTGMRRSVGIHGPTFEPRPFNCRSTGPARRRLRPSARAAAVVPGPLRAEVDEVEAVDGLGLAPGPGPHRRLGVAAERPQHPLPGDAAGGPAAGDLEARAGGRDRGRARGSTSGRGPDRDRPRRRGAAQITYDASSWSSRTPRREVVLSRSATGIEASPTLNAFDDGSGALLATFARLRRHRQRASRHRRGRGDERGDGGGGRRRRRCRPVPRRRGPRAPRRCARRTARRTRGRARRRSAPAPGR